MEIRFLVFFCELVLSNLANSLVEIANKMKFDGLGDIISICENHANSEIRPNRVKKNKLIFSTRSSN